MDIHQIFSEHAVVMERASELLPPVLADATQALQECLELGHKILVCGNGGSAATAQHFVAELVCRFRVDRRGLAAIALTADTAILTAIGNDYGYDRVFARQIEAIANPGDVVLAISTSGNSLNIIEAAKVARSASCRVIVLTGDDGGQLAAHADILIRAPSRIVARIQEVHDLCIHAIAETLEELACQEFRQ